MLLAPVQSAYGRPLAAVAREIGRHLTTMHRWREDGIIDSSGVRHRCRMTRVGGRWFVRDSDISSFFDALGGVEVDNTTP